MSDFMAIKKSELASGHRNILHLATVALTLLLLTLATKTSYAIPAFARQTGQNCVACHAGGQYPELTPYGRYFKLTGYTQGERQLIPLSAMFVGGMASTRNNVGTSSDGSTVTTSNINQQNGRFEADNASVFLAGKILDNLGLFSQFTYGWAASSNNGGINNQGHFGIDNFDLRYADHYASPTHDLIWGASLNNNPGVTDVWNSHPTWAYPYMSPQGARGAFAGGVPVATYLESGAGAQTAGYGAYVYLNKNFYAELDAYQSATGATSFLAYGNNNSNPNFPKAYLKGTNPYFRLAYTTEWGAHNLMVGAMGMNAAQYGYNSESAGMVSGGPPNLSGGTTNYQDRGIDAQYQYLLNPHTVTAQVRYLKENITDNTIVGPAGNLVNKLNSVFGKVSYVYNATYGAGLGYQNVTGTADSNAYGVANTGLSNWSASANNSPNSTAWIPSIWYQPIQNIRLTLQYTAFTKYMGGTSCYNDTTQGNPCRKASDNNTTWLYAWIAY